MLSPQNQLILEGKGCFCNGIVLAEMSDGMFLLHEAYLDLALGSRSCTVYQKTELKCLFLTAELLFAASI